MAAQTTQRIGENLRNTEDNEYFSTFQKEEDADSINPNFFDDSDEESKIYAYQNLKQQLQESLVSEFHKSKLENQTTNQKQIVSMKSVLNKEVGLVKLQQRKLDELKSVLQQLDLRKTTLQENNERLEKAQSKQGVVSQQIRDCNLETQKYQQVLKRNQAALQWAKQRQKIYTKDMERVDLRIDKGTDMQEVAERELQSMELNLNKMKKSSSEIHGFYMKKIANRNKEVEDLHVQIEEEVTQRAKLEIKHGLLKGKLQQLKQRASEREIKKASTIFAKTEIDTGISDMNQHMEALEQAFETDDIDTILEKWHATIGREKQLELEMEDKQEQMAEQKKFISLLQLRIPKREESTRRKTIKVDRNVKTKLRLAEYKHTRLIETSLTAKQRIFDLLEKVIKSDKLNMWCQVPNPPFSTEISLILLEKALKTAEVMSQQRIRGRKIVIRLKNSISKNLFINRSPKIQIQKDSRNETFSRHFLPSCDTTSSTAAIQKVINGYASMRASMTYQSTIPEMPDIQRSQSTKNICQNDLRVLREKTVRGGKLIKKTKPRQNAEKVQPPPHSIDVQRSFNRYDKNMQSLAAISHRVRVSEPNIFNVNLDIKAQKLRAKQTVKRKRGKKPLKSASAKLI